MTTLKNINITPAIREVSDDADVETNVETSQLDAAHQKHDNIWRWRGSNPQGAYAPPDSKSGTFANFVTPP